MKRNIIFLLLFIMLAVSAYFLVIKKTPGTLNEEETGFAVTDTASIGKIFIGDMQGNKVVIERMKNFWMLDKKYPVRNDYIRVLLSTIKNVAVSYPVQQAAINKVAAEMAAHNKKVEIYDTRGKLIRSYFVGGPSLDSHGTFMLMEGSTNPYVTAIPGFQGVLETRYTTDADAIRSTEIYNFRLNEIREVTVEYREKADSSFSISVLGPDSFQLRSAQGSLYDAALVDKIKLRSYLDLFSFINAEAYVNDLSKKDTILQAPPFCIITLIDRRNLHHTTACYRIPLLPDSPMQFDPSGQPMKFDNDRYFASINNGSDFVIVQRYHFGRLLKNISHMLKPRKPISK
jgi:hypothetical protein